MELKEGFFDTEEINDHEARETKEELLKKKLEIGEDKDINLDDVSDEDLDTALGLDDEAKDNLVNITLKGITESIDDVISCMESVNSSEEDIEEALRVQVGLKLEEAKEVYQDHLTETKNRSLVDRIYESLNLAQKIDKEDAEDAGLDFGPEKPVEATIDKDGVENPEKSLEDQKGVDFGKAPDLKGVVNEIEKPVVEDPDVVFTEKLSVQNTETGKYVNENFEDVEDLKEAFHFENKDDVIGRLIEKCKTEDSSLISAISTYKIIEG